MLKDHCLSTAAIWRLHRLAILRFRRFRKTRINHQQPDQRLSFNKDHWEDSAGMLYKWQSEWSRVDSSRVSPHLWTTAAQLYVSRRRPRYMHLVLTSDCEVLAARGGKQYGIVWPPASIPRHPGLHYKQGRPLNWNQPRQRFWVLFGARSMLWSKYLWRECMLER